MQHAIIRLIENIKADYARSRADYPDSIRKFNESVKISMGRKYIKIIQRGGVWGFVVKNDDGKFKQGDILMAASWAAPARNAARGNVFDDNYPSPWTGPVYLR